MPTHIATQPPAPIVQSSKLPVTQRAKKTKANRATLKPTKANTQRTTALRPSEAKSRFVRSMGVLLETVDTENCLGEGLRRLLRQVVADAVPVRPLRQTEADVAALQVHRG